MNWNWQNPDSPRFRYSTGRLAERETLFLRQNGVVVGTVRHLPDTERLPLVIEIMSTEALKTSEIEGDLLDRDSVQSSLRRQFGLQTDGRRSSRRSRASPRCSPISIALSRPRWTRTPCSAGTAG